ncbi:MAG: DUF6603 domain-containing protein [Bacteroidota bacterium]
MENLEQLQAFQDAIDTHITDLVFSLSDHENMDRDWSEIQALIGKVGAYDEENDASTLTVYGSSLTSDLDQETGLITFDGFIDNQFRLFELPDVYVAVSLTFSLSESGVKQLSIKLSDLSNYRISDSFPALTSTYEGDLLSEIVFEDASLTIDSIGQTATSEPTVTFRGTLQDLGPFEQVSWLFDVASPTLNGTMVLKSTEDGNYVPEIAKGSSEDANFLASFIQTNDIEWGYLDKLHFDLSVRIYSEFDATDQYFVSYAELVTEFNNPTSDVYIPIVMQLHGHGEGLLGFYLDSDEPQPDLSGSGAEGSDKMDSYDIFLNSGSLKKSFEGTDISWGDLSLDELLFTVHPESLTFTDIALGISLGSESGWSIIDDRFALTDLMANLSIANPSDAIGNMSLQLRAIFQVGDDSDGIDLYVGIELSTLAFSIGMVDGSEISISNFLDSFGDRDSVLEQEEGNTLSLTELELSGDIKNGTYGFEAAATGDLEIIPGIVFDGFGFEADYFDGATTMDFTAYFSLLIDESEVEIAVEASKDGAGAWELDGATTGGDSIPLGQLVSELGDKMGFSAVVPDPISDLTIDSLSFAYNTQSKDLSFSGSADFSINDRPVVLSIGVEVSHQQDGSPQTDFQGTLVIGSKNPAEFDLTFNADETSLMIADFADDSGKTEFDVGDLVNSLLSTDEVPSGLTLTLNSAFLAYLKDSTSSQFALGIDVGNGIDLSNLPLVGKLYPKGKNIALNYQLQYASSEFSSDDADTVNGNLPAAVHPLHTQSDGTVKQGLDLAMSMNLGEDLLPFDLNLAASGSEDDPVNGGVNPIPENTAPVVPMASGSPEDLKWFDIQKSFGPVHFHRIGAALSGDDLTFALDASFSLGGLEISLDGLEVTSSLTKFNPEFDLKGIGIDYSNPVLEIGAAFLRETLTDPTNNTTYDEYDGGALLRMEELTIGAIGSYAYVNGQPSLFIYAALDYPLGGPPFFFVTGLSLGFGYNRSLLVPSVDKVLEFPLVAEAMAGQALRADAGKDELSTELESIHTYVPVRIGQMFLAAGINFTTFKLIDSNILLAASFGNRFELDLLGVSTLIVPPETNGKESLAVIQMALKGAFIPDEGFVGLSGQLTSASYIISKDCRLNGGFAFYAWYSGDNKDEFVATIGGYHPSFKVPSYFPSVPRLSFNWQLDDHTHMSGDAYFALCAHAVMAGGHFEAVYEEGNLKAWYKVGADFLVAWKPYHYEASIYVNIGASYTYHFFGTHHISVDVGADVNIWGPEFGGHARVDLGVCSVSVDFGADKDGDGKAIEWEEFYKNFLTGVTPCTVAVGSGLVGKESNGDSDTGELWIVNAKELKLLTDNFVPARAVNWSSTELSPSDFNAEVGVAPMEIAAADFTSTQTVKVWKQNENDNTWSDDTSNFKPTIIKKKAPSGLWGQKLKPDVNDDQFIANTFAGLEIVPSSTLIPGQSSIISTSFVKYETLPKQDAFAWGTRTDFVDGYGTDEVGARTAIRDGDTESNDGITGAQVVARRNAVLEALGFSATIDLDSSLADDFVLAPQVAPSATVPAAL